MIMVVGGDKVIVADIDDVYDVGHNIDDCC